MILILFVLLFLIALSIGYFFRIRKDKIQQAKNEIDSTWLKIRVPSANWVVKSNNYRENISIQVEKSIDKYNGLDEMRGKDTAVFKDVHLSLIHCNHKIKNTMYDFYSNTLNLDEKTLHMKILMHEYIDIYYDPDHVENYIIDLDFLNQ